VSKGTHIAGKRMLAAVACGLALLVAGCGSDEEGKGIPKSSVADLERSLDSVQNRVEAGPGACKEVTDGGDTDVSVVQSKIDALPSDVDKDVKNALQDSFDHLWNLVKDECSKTQTETNTTTTEETTPPVTETAPPQTETTQTQTTPPQTTTTPTTDNKGKDKNKGNKGNGNGGGGEAAPGGE
jgi:hypothetical protein